MFVYQMVSIPLNPPYLVSKASFVALAKLVTELMQTLARSAQGVAGREAINWRVQYLGLPKL